MQELVNKFLCLSTHDRAWVLHRLSAEQRNKFKRFVSGNAENSSTDINLTEESSLVWRTAELNQFECELVFRVLDGMPYRLLVILFQYEGKPALDQFVKNSTRQDLISRVSSMAKMDVPERYGRMMAEYLVKRIKEFA